MTKKIHKVILWSFLCVSSCMAFACTLMADEITARCVALEKDPSAHFVLLKQSLANDPFKRKSVASCLQLEMELIASGRVPEFATGVADVAWVLEHVDWNLLPPDLIARTMIKLTTDYKTIAGLRTDAVIGNVNSIQFDQRWIDIFRQLDPTKDKALSKAIIGKYLANSCDAVRYVLFNPQSADWNKYFELPNLTECISFDKVTISQVAELDINFARRLLGNFIFESCDAVVFARQNTDLVDIDVLSISPLFQQCTAEIPKAIAPDFNTEPKASQFEIIVTRSVTNGPQATIEGNVSNDADIAELVVDGAIVNLGDDGKFKATLYVPRSGKTVEIRAFDIKGNKATKSLKLVRSRVQQATGPAFTSLNPSGKRVRPNEDALALIIGVADYERTPAKAAYADKDAQTFYDYALLKLGIPASNIKELVNADATEAEVRLAVKDWITRSTKQGQSDIYVFFAGHGLANQSDDNMYLLPVDGEPRLLSDTAIERERLFADIAAANPRSVTVFLDTCYSGTTRGTDMLVAARPIAIRAKEQAVPEGFTVMTAAAGDQTAKPLEEAKHGMFSYFLMKGMEGNADTNQDNQITAGELHAYVQQKVIQQSSGSQTPELQGDANRVLVRFQ